MEKLFGLIKNMRETIALGSIAIIMLTAEESFAQKSILKDQKGKISFSSIETFSDQNMPEGFRRDAVKGIENGQEKVVASIFWFEDGKTYSQFITKNIHPEVFIPEIDYEKINQIAKQKAGETVIAFEGAYENSQGNIEGIAIENGENVGSDQYSKSGFVYMNPDGNLEFYRTKDDQTGKFDTLAAEKLITRSKEEKGSLFQQIPAIWNGVEKLQTNSQELFEWRAICQTKTGKKFVLNCSEKITLKDFLILALNLEDENGEQLVDDLMMTDTGVYSYGIFRDNDQVFSDEEFKSWTMVDENYATNKSGYSNVVVIGLKH